MHKMTEIAEKKQKEIDRLANEVTVMKWKLEEKEKSLQFAKEENRKLFEQMKEQVKK